MDTADGAFMNVAYGWAFSKPVRKVYYNLTITGLSVAVALLVGTMEMLSILTQSLSLRGGIWDFLSSVNLNTIGFVIVGMFVVTWLGAFLVVITNSNKGATSIKVLKAGITGAGECSYFMWFWCRFTTLHLVHEEHSFSLNLLPFYRKLG